MVPNDTARRAWASARTPIRRAAVVCVAAALAAALPDPRGLVFAATPPCTNPMLVGRVSDGTGAIVARARISVTAGASAPVAEAWTAEDGRFQLCDLPVAELTVAVRSEGFSTWQGAVRPLAGRTTPLDVVLSLAPHTEELTVTPLRGDTRPVSWTPELVTTQDGMYAAVPPGTLLPVAFRQELGLHVQQTSVNQASPYVRGLTGQQVVTLVDGVRFNNATFRPGANQYTALLEAATAQRVEVVHGPNGTQYGSDALGGTINVLTRGTGAWTGPRPSTEISLGATGADQGFGGSVAGGFSWKGGGAFLAAGARGGDDLRTGGGVDSHSVATRLLGLPSSVLGDRLNETGYRQYGAGAKVVTQFSPAHALTLHYMHGDQRGASRYDMLDGGAGNLLHRFDPQGLDFGYARYDRVAAGPFSTFSVTASGNSQVDDREYQNINNSKLGLASDISNEHNRTLVGGLQAVGAFEPWMRQTVRTGLEYYGERVDSTRTDARLDPATGAIVSVADVRARYPDGARYSTLGAFVQDVVSVWPDRLQLQLGGRYSRFTYAQRAGDNPADAKGPLVPDFETSFDDLTGSVGAVLALTPHVLVTGNAARGFRAPNVNDFGTIGLSGGGFEVSPDEARRVSGSVLPPGAASPVLVGELGPEVLWSQGVGVRTSGTRVGASVVAYRAEITGMIERRTLLLPAGAVGTAVGGQPILRQDASGAVYTPVSSSAVFVRVNGTRVRLTGFDAALSGAAGRDLQWRATAGYVYGVDLADDQPPRIENGLPPLHGSATARWNLASGRAWADASLVWAATQHRLSDNDMKQARIGGTRTRAEIKEFFANGALARGLVANGVLLATGETVDQVTTRVLGSNASLPLYTSNAGFAVLSLGAGWRFGTHGRLSLLVENVFDENYRTMGSGVDGPGRNVILRQTLAF